MVVGSVIGHVAVPDMAAYVISKWGVRALVRQLQVDNRDRPGIRIEYVAPGGVDTPIYRQAATYGDAAGRPPFPVTTPERIADRALAVADGRRSGGQVGLANDVIRFGFTAFPWAYDRLVGPLFSLAAQDQTAEVGPEPGQRAGATRRAQRPAGWARQRPARHRRQRRRARPQAGAGRLSAIGPHRAHGRRR